MERLETRLPSAKLVTMLVTTMAVVQLWCAARVVAEQAKEPTPTSTSLGRRSFAARNDSAVDASFAQFLTALIAGAKSGNRETLLKMMASPMSWEFEPAKPEAVLEHFDVSKDHPWLALIDALELGTARVKEGYVAPYLHALSLDMADAAIVGRDVRVRAEPRADAAIVSVLSMELVELDRSHSLNKELFYRSARPESPSAWARVITPEGRKGYVYARFVYSGDDLRFVFESLDGVWKLTRVAAGD